MGDRCKIEPNALLRCISGQSALCEIGTVVGDDAIGNTISAYNVGHKSDRSRTIQLLDRAGFNPLGKLVYCNQEMCHATSGCLERTNHVETPHRKWPCYWDCLQC